MKSLHFIIIAFLSFTCYACASGQKNGNEDDQSGESERYYDLLKEKLIGQWKNSAFKVDVHTYNNTDTSFTVDINQNNWDIKMEVQPYITTLHKDGSYNGIQKDLEGNVIANPHGKWTLDGDTLILKDNKDNIYKYKVLIEEGNARFKSKLDYDNDGKRDDDYEGIQKKISNH